MKLKHLTGFLFVFFLLSCSTPNQKPKKLLQHSYAGLSIENGRRQGFQYVDSLGTEYGFGYITTTLTNDSTVPLRIKMGFSNAYHYPAPYHDQQLRVFLVPGSAVQQFDKGLGGELTRFLDTVKASSVTLDQIIQPKEKCVVTFGVLTNKKYLGPGQLALVSKGHVFPFEQHKTSIQQAVSGGEPFALSLGLDFVDHSPSHSRACYLVIACGEILFPE